MSDLGIFIELVRLMDDACTPLVQWEAETNYFAYSAKNNYTERVFTAYRHERDDVDGCSINTCYSTDCPEGSNHLPFAEALQQICRDAGGESSRSGRSQLENKNDRRAKVSNFEWGCKSPENMAALINDVRDAGVECPEKQECMDAIEAAKSIYDMPELPCHKCLIEWLSKEHEEAKGEQARV